MALPYEPSIAALDGPEPASPKGSTSITCPACGEPFLHAPKPGSPPGVCPECRGDDDRPPA